MSENTVPIKKNMLNMSLFSIIFIIFYYLINKINKKYDCFVDVSNNSDINAAIVNAVNNKYKADVEAIRNLSSIAYALHKENNLIVPADLTILGTIKSNKIDLGYNHEGREGNSGKIEYGTYHDTNALCIIGKGIPGSDRIVHLWDNLIVNKNLNVSGDQTVNGNTILKGTTINGGLQVNATLNVSGGMGADNITTTNDGGNGFSISASTNNNLNRWLFNNYPGDRKLGLRPWKSDGTGWDNTVFTINNNGTTTVGGDLNVEINTTLKGTTILKGASNNNPSNDQTFFGHSNGNNYIRGGTIFDRGDISVTGAVNTNKIIVGASHDGTSNTITDGVHGDHDALCIIGKGAAGVPRKVQLWDNVVVGGNLSVGGAQTIGSNLSVGGHQTCENNLMVKGNLNVGGTGTTFSQINCDWINNNGITPNANLNLSSSNSIHLIPHNGGSVYATYGKLHVNEIVMGNCCIWTVGNKIYIGPTNKNMGNSISINTSAGDCDRLAPGDGGNSVYYQCQR